MILLFIAGIVAYVLWVNIYMIYIMMTVPKKSIKEINDEAKSGDIILFKQGYKSYFLKHVANFSHTGVIIVHPITREKYIVESFQMERDKVYLHETDGVHIFPLYNKLMEYDGELFHLKLRNSVDDSIVMKFINNLPSIMKDISFNYDLENYIMTTCTTKRLCPHCFDYKKYSNKLVCTEFTAFVLKKLGIISPDIDHYCLFPGDFRNIIENGIQIYEQLSYINRKNI